MFVEILFIYLFIIENYVAADIELNSTNTPDVMLMLTKMPPIEMSTDHQQKDAIDYNLDSEKFIDEKLPMEKLQDKIISDFEYDVIQLTPQFRQSFAKQAGAPSNPISLLVNRAPCTCQKGVCGCCTSFILALFRSKACMNITYFPEDFAFEVKMLLNDRVMYKNTLSGRNPRPICIRPPRFDIIELCAVFHDIYFVGRNMHFCLDMGANFQGFELFNRSFNCMRIGDQGVKIVRPEDGGGITHRPSLDADVDDGSDDIEDYDENVVRRNIPVI